MRIEKLEKTELMLNQALAFGKGALWHWEGNDTKFYLSASYYQVLGFLPYESLSKETGLIDHIHPEDRFKIESAFHKAFFEDQQIFDMEFRSVTKTGKEIWMSCSGQAINKLGGNDQKILMGVIYDISKFKEIEKKSDDNERQLTTLMSHVPGMVYQNKMVDGKWKVEFISNGVKALLGYEKKYFMANREAIYKRIIDEDERREIWKAIDESIEKQQPYELVYRIKTSRSDYIWVWDKGEIFLSETGSPVSMEGFIMDITTFKHEEIRLQSFIRSASSERYKFGNIIGRSQAMQKIYEHISMASETDATVIIYGESGTGKELVARAIHETSKKKNYPIITVNCGAISEKLLESEFFGYKKGAFTGAGMDKDGFLAAAEGGTLFLDEIGEISLEFQVKLLRVLDGHGYTPVGSNTNKKTNIRVIAATNKNLEELVQQGKMRQDFYYRIHIIPITVPPLRERRQDISLLIDHFVDKYRKNETPTHLPGRFSDVLHAYDWPGNIRELENVVQRYVTLGEIEPFDINHYNGQDLQSQTEFPFKSISGGFKAMMENFEKQVLTTTLEKNKWRRDKTANELGLTRRTLYRKMGRHGLK